MSFIERPFELLRKHLPRHLCHCCSSLAGFSRPSIHAVYQYALKEETDARHTSRAKKVLDRREEATASLHTEEALRDAARREDQTVGPWGISKVEAAGKIHGTGGVEGDGPFRHAPSGAHDGLGVFHVNVGGEDCKGFREGGKGAATGDGSEVQLFQPLQQGAHEER